MADSKRPYEAETEQKASVCKTASNRLIWSLLSRRKMDTVRALGRMEKCYKVQTLSFVFINPQRDEDQEIQNWTSVVCV